MIVPSSSKWGLWSQTVCSQLSHLPPVWSWASYQTSLHLGFLICKIGAVIMSTSKGWGHWMRWCRWHAINSHFFFCRNIILWQSVKAPWRNSLLSWTSRTERTSRRWHRVRSVEEDALCPKACISSLFLVPPLPFSACALIWNSLSFPFLFPFSFHPPEASRGPAGVLGLRSSLIIGWWTTAPRRQATFGLSVGTLHPAPNGSRVLYGRFLPL